MARIDSRDFQSSINQILDNFGSLAEGEDRHGLVHTYQPIQPISIYMYTQDYDLLPIIKKELSQKDKKMIDEFLRRNIKGLI